MSVKYNYLFGPVPSRRLGRSLGIDVTPDKSCSFDCLFCQCGETLEHTSARSEVVPFQEVCGEIERWLAEDGQADYITFAGSGEPTLYSRLGELIPFIKERTEIPVILLSNGTLMHLADVRADAANADIVKLSLSAWDEESFRRVNRPAPGLTFRSTIEGERAFRDEFNGQLWLEVFLMRGVNDAPEQIRKIAELAKRIRPDKIHLNTVVRPPAETAAQPVEEETLISFCDLFTPRAEVIASFKAAPETTKSELNPETLTGLIDRHPATAQQLADIFGTNSSAIQIVLDPLVNKNRLKKETRDGDVYYKSGVFMQKKSMNP